MTDPRIPVLQLIASSHGGGASHVLDLVRGLSPQRFAVTVAMPVDGGNVSPQDAEAAGAKFLPLPIDRGLNVSTLARLHGLLAQFALVHVHGARAGLYGRFPLLFHRRRPAVVFSIHGFATPFYAQPKRGIYLALERLLQRVTHRTLCVAQAEANLFLQHGLSDPARITVIHPGIDADRFANVEANSRLRADLDLPDGPILLTVCRLHVPRDFETLLAAFAKIAPDLPQATLLIAGDGPMRTAVSAQIDALGLNGRVRLLGFRQDVPALLALADVYTLTSYGWEGFPISTLEAQAAGVPVVVTDAGGSREAVRHGETGLVIPRRDADALAGALRRLLTDDALRQRLGTTGRTRIRLELSREKMVGQITAVYNTLLPRK